jgi:hypothetical protein
MRDGWRYFAEHYTTAAAKVEVLLTARFAIRRDVEKDRW